MGTRGPVPNADADLARPRERKGSDVEPTTFGVARPTSRPEPHPHWDGTVMDIWDSLTQSGQSDFYQQSDWALAVFYMDEIQLYRQSGRRSAEQLRNLQAGMDRLLMTEGERRRARIQLGPAPEANTTAEDAIADYRLMLGLVDEKGAA